jgi:hypothetical protein
MKTLDRGLEDSLVIQGRPLVGGSLTGASAERHREAHEIFVHSIRISPMPKSAKAESEGVRLAEVKSISPSGARMGHA